MNDESRSNVLPSRKSMNADAEPDRDEEDREAPSRRTSPAVKASIVIGGILPVRRTR